LRVLVENHAGQKGPVNGTVGNLPATQQVAGTVNVPAVQDVQVVSQPAQQVVLQATVVEFQ
jgi:hypothetical protein